LISSLVFIIGLCIGALAGCAAAQCKTGAAVQSPVMSWRVRRAKVLGSAIRFIEPAAVLLA
jgi:hypothetical protein